MRKHNIIGHPNVAVAYLRASTDEQRHSSEAQRACIQAWAIREGARAWQPGTPIAASAASPRLQRRPDRRSSGAAGGARQASGGPARRFAKRDRIARDVVLAVEVERAAVSAGARLASATGEGNGDSPADAFVQIMIDGAAQYEHDPRPDSRGARS